ncbi:MAG: methyltransferase [Proteobacteria bacterium]|nr:methyltransferase [Pseudomonadota bacterium]MCP4919929.1 methyltransferase [Pseudomonadota bacterium]
MPEQPPLEGDWQLEYSGLPDGGPQRWWRSARGIAVSGPPHKLGPELEGRERGAGHPALARVIDTAEGWVVFEPLGPAPQDALAAVSAWPGEARVATGPLLSLIPACRVNVRRALRKLDCSKVDRTLDRPAEATVVEGPSLGGIHGGWLRQAGDRVVCLRFARFTREGRPDVDRAVTAYRAGLAFSDLGLLPHLLEEAILGRDDDAAETAREVFSRLARPEPSTVTVEVSGAPEWLDTSAWTGSRTPAQARRILHAVAGLTVTDHTLAVSVNPPIRKGRAARFEDRGVRRRRLFSRWYEGIRVDDEGLLSLTPEALADELVAGVAGTVLDATCGVGGLAIAAARTGARVVASDVSAQRLELAGSNAAIYDVELDLRRGDATRMVREVAHDVLLLDPPWGGRGYDRESMGLEDLGFDLGDVLAGTSAEVRLKLPRSFRVDELPGGPWTFRGAIDARGVLKFLVATRC